MAIGAVTGGFENADPVVIIATVVCYPLVTAMILALVLGPGRGLHDRLAGTRVVPAPTTGVAP